MTPRVLQRGTSGSATLVLYATLATGAKDARDPIASWSWTDMANRMDCLELPAQMVELGGARTRAWLALTARGGAVALDETTLRAH